MLLWRSVRRFFCCLGWKVCGGLGWAAISRDGMNCSSHCVESLSSEPLEGAGFLQQDQAGGGTAKNNFQEPGSTWALAFHKRSKPPDLTVTKLNLKQKHDSP